VRAVTFLDFYRSCDGRRVLLYQALGLAASAIALSLSLGDGRLDLTIARWFFDDARRIFHERCGRARAAGAHDHELGHAVT